MNCAKTAEPIHMSFGKLSWPRTKEARIRWGVWRHLVNTTKPSVCGGDAAFCQITLTTYHYYESEHPTLALVEVPLVQICSTKALAGTEAIQHIPKL